jgi:peptide/nickel transport system substrate-binding protein
MTARAPETGRWAAGKGEDPVGRFTTRALVSIYAVLALVMVAVAWSPANASAAKPKSGGTVTFGGISAVLSLVPGVTTGNSTAGLNELEAVYGILEKYDTQAKQYVPDMAKSLTHNADYTTWTLDLRPNITFTDGTPYDAAAVVQNIKGQQIPASLTAGEFASLTSMTTPNDLTVVFHYSTSFPALPIVLAQKNGAIAAPSFLNKVAAGNVTATPIGAGPFMVQSFTPGVSLSLVANPHYFLGKPYLDGLKFVYIPGGPATYQAFQTGQLQSALLTDYNSADMAKSAGVPTYTELQPGGNIFVLNETAGQPFSNQGLRQAVQAAIDANLQEINTGLFNGAGKMSALLFPKGTTLYAPAPVPKMTLAAEQAAVQSAKTALNWDGTLRLMCGNAPSVANEPTALEAILKPLGLNFTVNLVSTPQSINIVNVTHAFDIGCYGRGIGNQPTLTMYQYVSVLGYDNPQMTSLINQLSSETTLSAQQKTLVAIQKLWFDTVPFIVLAPGDDTVISASNLHGIIHSSQCAAFFDKAWLS